MRRMMTGVLCAVVLLGAAGRASARQAAPAPEAGYSLGAVGANFFYLPAKVVVAATGAVVGSFAGLLSGGSERAAYGLWVPMVGGTWLLTPEHLDGSRPIQFFGSDYADTPSAVSEETDGSRIYDAMYSRAR
ncbi:MAG: hypothetical protein U0807_18590 [Candidatus Binatia bacterium]